MQDRKTDQDESSSGGEQLSLDPPAGDWARTGRDSWLCAALAELPRAIQLLPAAEQAVVIGYYFDERSIDELAASLQMEPSRVDFVLEQALRELRRRVPH